jgi:hypothetical protein
MAHPPSISSVVDRHLVDYGPDPVPDPTLHFDADPDSIPSSTKDGKSGEKFVGTFTHSSPVYTVFIFLVSVYIV